MNGILCIDKPQSFTSHDVVAKMRGILKTKKIGHGGTLDPMATGVLPLFVGRATKACDILPDQNKRYIAGLKLGAVTDTQDSAGTVLKRGPVTVSRVDVERVLPAFLGPQKQIPPMYSAVQVKGQRLYDLARRGVEVERAPRDITVFSITILEQTDADEYLLDIACSKGTYIRTLCHDMGARLGCGGMMSSLRRTISCGYGLRDCITLEEAQALADAGTLAEQLLPLESAFATYPRVALTQRQVQLFHGGIALSLDRMRDQADWADGMYAVFGPEGGFLAVARADLQADSLKQSKWFGPTPA